MSMIIWQQLLFILLGFFSGSIMFSYLLPKLIYKKDIISLSDDHNPGMANVLTYAGKKMGAICLVLDMAKGFIPVYFAGIYLEHDNLLFSLVISAPVLGHAFCPFLKFKGGKAVAVTFGSLLGTFEYSLSWLILALSTLFFTAVISIYPHSLRIIISVIPFVVYTLIFEHCFPVTVGCLIISIVLTYTHIRGYNSQPFNIKFFCIKKPPIPDDIPDTDEVKHHKI